jgi:hypothetical protein
MVKILKEHPDTNFLCTLVRETIFFITRREKYYHVDFVGDYKYSAKCGDSQGII